jgi:hypothetical protein
MLARFGFPLLGMLVGHLPLAVGELNLAQLTRNFRWASAKRDARLANSASLSRNF